MKNNSESRSPKKGCVSDVISWLPTLQQPLIAIEHYKELCIANSGITTQYFSWKDIIFDQINNLDGKITFLALLIYL